jgi:hypothetical protein
MIQPPFNKGLAWGDSTCPAIGLHFPLPFASADAIGWTAGMYREVAGGCKKKAR